MEKLYIIILAYLIGSISGSYILGKAILKIDIRNYGSGNAGTTNAIRVMGKKLGVFVFIIDFFKAVACMLIVMKCWGKEYTFLAMIFCSIGHCFPFYMKFKGGKGVAVTFGSLAIINYQLTAILFLCWVIFALISKNIGMASVFMYICSAIVFCFFGGLVTADKVLVLLNSTLGILRHESNIRAAFSK